MPNHSLPRGIELIEGLERLGIALGYVAEKERPVEQGRNNPPAVDVAWLREVGQDYPLMIFEVESRATNAAANNPVKVFGQLTEKFEKPLFFFHVFVSVGSQTTRIENLRNLFGSYNYRAYRLDQDGSSILLRDVLSQHRRLYRRLDLTPLLDELGSSVWSEIELSGIIEHIEKLDFSSNYLLEYASRARSDQRFQREYLRLLSRISDSTECDFSIGSYETYMGHSWSTPIEIGLLAFSTPADQNWLEHLRNWQEDTSYLSMIGPHFYQSRDYDCFVLGASPVLWALIASLMNEVEGAAQYICDQMVVVLDCMKNAKAEDSFFTAIWLLHVAAAASDESRYEYARTYINKRNGISSDILLKPPSTVNMEDDEFSWLHAISCNAAPVECMESFKKAALREYGDRELVADDYFRVALQILVDDTAFHSWSEHVASLLHGRAAGV